jgi:hypothetical protein
MRKIFTISFFFLTFHNLFGQNCNLEFGIKIDYTNKRFIDNYTLWFCSGIPITLIADDLPNASYQWFLDDKEIKGATKISYSIGDVGGKYTVKVISGSCKYSRDVKINFSESFAALLHIGSKSSMCEKNGWARLVAYPYPEDNFKYQWQMDKIDIEGAVYYDYRAEKPGVYTVRVTQGKCNTTTKPVEVKPSDLKTNQIIINKIVYTRDTTLTFCEGKSVQMLTEYEMAIYTDFKVFKDNKLIPFNNGGTIRESGKYRIELKKGDCQLVTPTIEINFIKSLPKLSIGGISLVSECGEKNIYITNTSEVVDFANGNDITAEWQRDGIKQVEQNIWSPFVINEVGTYKAIVKNGQCIGESSPLEVKALNKDVIPLRIYNINSKRVEACLGQALSLYFFSFGKGSLELYKDNKLIHTTDKSQLPLITESGKYYAIIREANVCTQYSDTLEVILKGRKAATITLNNALCQNDIFSLSVEKGEGLTYAWQKNGKAIPNANEATFTTKEAGNYSVIINQDYCSVASSEISVGAKIIANSTICEGQILQLSTSIAKSYEWTGPNGFTSTIQNPNIPKAIVANQGQYFLKTVNGNNCTFRDSVNIKVNSSPIFSVEIPEVICLGKSFTITTKSLNNNLVYYNMSSPDNVGFGFSSSLTRDNATQKMAGIYTITAIDYKNQCTSTTIAKVNINTESDCPSITIADLSKIKICYNSEVEIPFTIAGKFAPNTIFTINYIDYDGKLQALGSGTKSPIKVRISAYYRLIITANDRNISSSPSDYVNITYINYPSISYTNLSACTGYKVDLKVDYKYDKIQWKLDGKIIDGAISANYSATQSGAYSVDVSQNGCISSTHPSSETKVIIGKLDKPYVYSQNTPYVCEGFTVDLLSSNYPKDVSFQWNLDGKPIDKMNAPTIKAAKKGSYTLTIKQGTCEATSDPRQVYVGDILPNRVIGYGSNGSEYDPTQVDLCKGTPYYLYYAPYWDRYAPDSFRREVQLQWQKDGVDIEKADSVSYKIEKDGNYRLKISQGSCVAYSKTTQIKFTNKIKLQLGYSSNLAYSDGNKNIVACSGDSVNLYFYSKGELHYNFPTAIYSNDKIIKELPKDNNTFYTSKSGSYWVTQTYPIEGSQETCVAISDTVNVKIGGNKIETFSENISSCLDTISLYSNFYSSGRFRWKFNDNYLPKDTLYSIKSYQSGTYQWEYTTKNCQFISKPFTVTFGKLEASLENPYKEIPCYGEIFGLSPQIKSYAYYYNKNEQVNPPSFQWQKDGIDFSKEQYIENVQKGTYSVTIKQGKCSVTTNPITIDYKKISREITPKDSASFCSNGSFVELSSAEDATYKYTWAKDKKAIPNQTKSSIKASESGVYQTQIESGDCATLSYPVKVYQKIILPTAIISGGKEIIAGDSTRIKIDLTSSAPWTIKLTNNQTFTAEKTPFEFNVKPTQTTVYELASIKNGCGDGTVNGKAEIKIIILGNEEIEGAKINLFPIPTQSTCQLTVEMALPEKLEWQLFSSNGKLLSKAEKTKIVPFFSQNIDLESLPSGTYLLKIIVGNKIVTRKIIKQI